jgi:hypothetical protein
MSAPATLSAAPVATPAAQAKTSEYSLTHVFAMPTAFLLVLILTRLAAG